MRGDYSKKYLVNVVKYFQIFLYFIMFVPLRLIYTGSYTNVDNFKKIGKKTLIISNHVSRIDAYLVLAFVPLKHFLKSVPYRIPVAKKYYYNPLYNFRFFPFLTLSGGIPVGLDSEEKMRSVFLIRNIINTDQSLLIFPEGKMSKDGSLQELQKGIEFFVKDVQKVVFVKIKKTDSYLYVRCGKIKFSDIKDPDSCVNTEMAKNNLNLI